MFISINFCHQWKGAYFFDQRYLHKNGYFFKSWNGTAGYAYVKIWKIITLEQEVNGLGELELLIQRLASENGIDVTKPFLLMAMMWVKNMSCQVIDWQTGVLHTSDTHSQFAQEIWHSASTVMLAGFYSENHKGVYTNYNRKINTHAITTDPMTTGHLETIKTFGNIASYFPDNTGISKSVAVEALKLQANKNEHKNIDKSQSKPS